HPGADPALRIQRIINGAADVFLLVVEAGVDFVEPARFGPALAELAPIINRLAGRSSVAPAGEVAAGIGGHLFGLQAELESVNLAGIAAGLGVGCRGDKERCERNEDGRVGWAKARGTARIGFDGLSRLCPRRPAPRCEPRTAPRDCVGKVAGE